jgi:hypothetical protein
LVPPAAVKVPKSPLTSAIEPRLSKDKVSIGMGGRKGETVRLKANPKVAAVASACAKRVPGKPSTSEDALTLSADTVMTTCGAGVSGVTGGIVRETEGLIPTE